MDTYRKSEIARTPKLFLPLHARPSNRCTISRPQYAVKDLSENVAMVIRAPFCICDGPYACCCDNKFTVGLPVDPCQDLIGAKLRFRSTERIEKLKSVPSKRNTEDSSLKLIPVLISLRLNVRKATEHLAHTDVAIFLPCSSRRFGFENESVGIRRSVSHCA